MKNLQTAQTTDRIPYAWEVTQGARTYLVTAAEFTRNSYDTGTFKPLYEEAAAPAITQEMLYAAINEAVKQGLVPKAVSGEEHYLKIHNQIQAVLVAGVSAS